MTLSSLFAFLIFVTVAVTAFSIGLVVSFEMVRSAVRRPRFWALVGLSVVAIPLLAYLIANALVPELAKGVMICAFCAGGPLALKATQISGSDLTWSLTLTVTLLVANVVTLPVWSTLLLDRSVTLRPSDLVGVLLTAILIPVLLGGWSGRRLRNVDRWFRTATLASNVGLFLAVVVGLIGSFEGLVTAAGSWLLIVVFSIIVLSAVVGWLVRDEPGRRRAGMFTTMNRATSVALLVIGRAYVDEPAVFTTAVLYGLVQTLLALGLAAYWAWARSDRGSMVVITR